MADKGKNTQNDLFGTTKSPRKGAMYVRMSTDHQKYSIENQEAAMREYAARHDIDLIKTYGLRRVLVDEQRQRKAELKRGEHKSLQTDRVAAEHLRLVS